MNRRDTLIKNLGKVPGAVSTTSMSIASLRESALDEVDAWAERMFSDHDLTTKAWKLEEYKAVQAEAQALLSEKNPDKPKGEYPCLMAEIGILRDPDPNSETGVAVTLRRVAEIILKVMQTSTDDMKINIRVIRTHTKNLIRSAMSEGDVKVALMELNYHSLSERAKDILKIRKNNLK